MIDMIFAIVWAFFVYDNSNKSEVYLDIVWIAVTKERIFLLSVLDFTFLFIL